MQIISMAHYRYRIHCFYLILKEVITHNILSTSPDPWPNASCHLIL